MSTPHKLTIHIQEPYYSYALDGTKTVEGRLNKGKFAPIQTGDKVIIIDTEFVVTGTAVYSTFLEMVTTEGFASVIPDKSTPAEAADVYYRFFTPEQERQHGVKAIRIQRL